MNRLVDAICSVVGSAKMHEIFTEYIALELWEDMADERRENQKTK